MMLKDKPASKDEAIASAEKAYALREGLEPALQLRAMQSLAGTYLFLQPEKVEQGFRLAAEARALAQRLRCLDDEVSILNLLSLKYFVLKKVDEVVQTAREAAALTLPNDDDPAPRRIALQVQASGEMMRENHEAAIQLCMEALGIVESAWARERVEELRRRYLSQAKAICTQLIRNLYALYARRPSREYARQAFDFAERSRSRSLLDQMSNDAIRAALATNVHLLDREQKLLQQISSFQRRWVVHWTEEPMNLDRSLALIDERAKLFAERMELQGEIGRLTQNMGQIAPLSPIRAEEAQRRLLADQPRSAILFYQLGPQESFLIVLTRDDARLFKLPDWKTIARAANEWRERIMEQQAAKQLTAEQLHAYAKAAYRLYELLLKPAASVIRGRDLIIVATHPIQELPFEALVTTNPEDGRWKMEDGRWRMATDRVDPPSSILYSPQYLVEKHAITYALSISVLAVMEERERQATPGKEILLVGDPVFNNRDPRLANPKEPDAGEAGLLAMNDQPRFRQGLYRLPATEGEVLGIAELGRQHGLQPTLWLGFDANEKNFKAHNLLGYRLVHLATHGVADEQDGNLSAILLSMNQKDGSDGLLTTDEVSRLRLDADLVVLSGCRTGSGAQTKAEGIIGLSRAFIVAGARRVCGSLWRVDDRLTQEFMLTFYTALLDQRLSPSESLRQAKLHFLRQGVAPANWSPFIVVGSPR
jgi:CHAT domain-containing protein